MFNPNDFTILVDNGQYGTYGTVKTDTENDPEQVLTRSTVQADPAF